MSLCSDVSVPPTDSEHPPNHTISRPFLSHSSSLTGSGLLSHPQFVENLTRLRLEKQVLAAFAYIFKTLRIYKAKSAKVVTQTCSQITEM